MFVRMECLCGFQLWFEFNVVNGSMESLHQFERWSHKSLCLSLVQLKLEAYLLNCSCVWDSASLRNVGHGFRDVWISLLCLGVTSIGLCYVGFRTALVQSLGGCKGAGGQIALNAGEPPCSSDTWKMEGKMVHGSVLRFQIMVHVLACAHGVSTLCEAVMRVKTALTSAAQCTPALAVCARVNVHQQACWRPNWPVCSLETAHLLCTLPTLQSEHSPEMMQTAPEMLQTAPEL